MTIKQQGGIFGRNPSFNDLETNTAYVVDELGVGESNPARVVHVKASVPAIRLEDSDVSGLYHELLGTAGGQLQIKVDGGNVQASSEIAMIVDGATAGTFGSTGLAFPSGKGIDFSATSGTGTSELFSDYEEGTFSPVFADAISGGNLASTSNTYAQYTKVGNVVHCTISMLNINTTGLTAGNTAYIQGLPFATVSAGTSRFFPIYVRADGITSTVGIQGWILANAVTYIGLENVTITGKANLLVSAISSGVSDLAVSFSYFTS